jgi:hypothetical protein
MKINFTKVVAAIIKNIAIIIVILEEGDVMTTHALLIYPIITIIVENASMDVLESIAIMMKMAIIFAIKKSNALLYIIRLLMDIMYAFEQNYVLQLLTDQSIILILIFVSRSVKVIDYIKFPGEIYAILHVNLF